MEYELGDVVIKAIPDGGISSKPYQSKARFLGDYLHRGMSYFPPRRWRPAVLSCD